MKLKLRNNNKANIIVNIAIKCVKYMVKIYLIVNQHSMEYYAQINNPYHKYYTY